MTEYSAAFSATAESTSVSSEPKQPEAFMQDILGSDGSQQQQQHHLLHPDPKAQTASTLPIWFQAIKGTSAIHSGVMNLPMIISFVIASVSGGLWPHQVDRLPGDPGAGEQNIAKEVPSIDPETVVNVGVMALYHVVIVAYNRAMTHTFYVGVAMACLSVLGAVLEWVYISAA
ncbi:hypothetical protein BO94DRAFT_588272 [Aspergillus sclerotioniger CBS 115572]|uniref:Uncharacterized protein n=1 Tax=Aspergillus sclerotioniger CBS 115572 TaxID=1450535 RepID=A0A317VW69_9EURO|nr:hypothetical protein BO94DRAFT_588272 [Aspergillus sclerotioniger CBS 115572]PWY78553.1 hypothetical protein BO94DRAFT_588272 [Aspergillus sclerotioniger CBS 115572]